MKIKSKPITFTASFAIGVFLNFFIMRFLAETSHSEFSMIIFGLVIYFLLGFFIEKLFAKISEISSLYTIGIIVPIMLFFFVIIISGIIEIKIILYSLIPLFGYISGIYLAKNLKGGDSNARKKFW